MAKSVMSVLRLHQSSLGLSKAIGEQAEQFAHDYLVQHGLRCLTRNFSCRSGEIDLIMQDNATVVFVEVRYRQSNRFGSALESVNFQKQQKLIKTAHYYLQSSPSSNSACRFDVIGLSPNDQQFDIDWIKDAFSA